MGRKTRPAGTRKSRVVAGNASFTNIDRQEYILDRGVCAESSLSSSLELRDTGEKLNA